MFAFLLCCQSAFAKFHKNEIGKDEVVTAFHDLFLNFQNDIIEKLI